MTKKDESPNVVKKEPMARPFLVRLAESDNDWLNQYSAESGVPKSILVRVWIRQQRKKLTALDV